MCTRSIKLLLALICLALVSACGGGPRQVRGELPLVTLDGLERQGDQITLQLGLRNINDGPLVLSEVNVELRLGDDPLVRTRYTPDFEIGPRGRDVLTLRGPGQPAGLLRLSELDADLAAATGRERPRNIAWSMELTLADERGRTRDAEISGFLHPVPGQPGRFR